MMTKWNCLHLAVFVVAKNDFLFIQKDILVLDVSEGRRTATAVQQKIDNHPIPINGKSTGGRGAFQQNEQFFVGVGLLDSFHLFELRRFYMTELFPVAPMEKGCDDSHITADRVCRQLVGSHFDDHHIQMLPSQIAERHRHVEIVSHPLKMVAISKKGFVCQSSGRAINQKAFYGIVKRQLTVSKKGSWHLDFRHKK